MTAPFDLTALFDLTVLEAAGRAVHSIKAALFDKSWSPSLHVSLGSFPNHQSTAKSYLGTLTALEGTALEWTALFDIIALGWLVAHPWMQLHWRGLYLRGLHLRGLYLRGLHLRGLHLSGLHSSGLHSSTS